MRAMDKNRLIAELTNPDEETRHEAREQLHEMMDDEIARALLDIALSDASVEARADAVIGLGPAIEEASWEYGDDADDVDDDDPDLDPPISRDTFETVVREVRALYDDEKQPKLIRRRALEVLVRDPQEWQAPEIRKHFGTKDAEWMRTAVFAMGHVPGFAKEIGDLVNSTSDSDLLYEAVRAAGRQEVRSVAPRLRELAVSNKGDKDVRLAAIYSLPDVDDDCFEILDELSRSQNSEIAEVAEAALEELQMNLGSDDLDDLDEDED